MQQVKIYIETDNTSPAKRNRQYAVILECDTAMGPAQKGFFGYRKATYHQIILVAMAEALNKLNRSCEVEIYTRNEFVVNAAERNLDQWRKNGFKNVKGEDIKNKEEWAALAGMKEKHLIRLACGEHQYSGWMLGEMERRKDVQEKKLETKPCKREDV